MRWLKRILPWALGAAIVAALVWAYMPKPVAVDLGTATRGPFEESVAESGRTRVRQRFAVAAPVNGTLVRITLRAGDLVERGTVVARVRPLDPPLLDTRSRAQALARVRGAEAAREQARQQVERAEALVSFARAESARARSLALAASAPARSVEAAEVEQQAREKEAAAAKWALKVASSELEAARAALAEFTRPSHPVAGVDVRAPAQGVVLRVLQESEAPVAAGAPLLEIGDPGELEVVVDLLTPDAVRVVPGAVARIEGWGRDGAVAARVRRVEPGGFTKISALGVEEQRVTVVLDTVDRVPGVGDGFRAEVTITLFSASDVLQVPASAAFRSEGGWAVFVAQDGRVRLRPITIGHRNDAAVEVLSGLRNGERVLLHPSERVRDGARYAERAPAASGV